MVIILSRDSSLYSTRSLALAFTEHGESVRIIDTLSVEVKVGLGVFLDGEKLTPHLVIPRLSSSVLLPGLAALREWEREEVPIVNSSSSIALASDQLATLQHLSAHHLPIPETSFCSQPETDQTFTSVINTLPRVIKLLNGSQGKGVTLANSFSTARSVLSTLAFLKSSGISQRFHPEAKGEDLRILVYQGHVLASMRRSAKPDDFRSNLHQGGSVHSYHADHAEETLAITATLALGLTFAGVDIINTSEGPLILEVNASPGLEGIENGDIGTIGRHLTSLLEKNDHQKE